MHICTSKPKANISLNPNVNLAEMQDGISAEERVKNQIIVVACKPDVYVMSHCVNYDGISCFFCIHYAKQAVGGWIMTGPFSDNKPNQKCRLTRGDVTRVHFSLSGKDLASVFLWIDLKEMMTTQFCLKRFGSCCEPHVAVNNLVALLSSGYDILMSR